MAMPKFTLTDPFPIVNPYPKISLADFFVPDVPSKEERRMSSRGFKSQKAKGIYASQRLVLPGVGTIVDPIHYVPRMVGSKIEFPCFARPCPLRPRHGFIDSRTVRDIGEVFSLYAQVQDEEPGGEIVLMPRIKADCSAVAHNGGVTWGLGNDGATADNGAVFIPAAVDVERWHRQLKYMMYGPNWEDTGIEECAYLELVAERKGPSYVVQMRDGPAQTAERDFFPEKPVKVKRFIDPADVLGDLLKWEALVKEAAEEKGVVFNNIGGTLSSHYSVHAITANIPVICSRAVNMGETLEPTKNKRKGLSKEALAQIAASMEEWTKDRIPDKDLANFYQASKGRLLTAVATIHGQHIWDDAEHLNRLRAFAPPILMRYLTTACVGEMRHWQRHGPGRDGNRVPKMLVEYITELEDNPYIDRGDVYTDVLKETDFDKLVKVAEACEDGFKEGWKRKYSESGRSTGGGYGGPKWARVAQATVQLGKAIQVFTVEPTRTNWNTVVMQANNAIHQAHNGGKTLEKFDVGSDRLTYIEQCPSFGLLNSFAGRLALDLVAPKVEAVEVELD